MIVIDVTARVNKIEGPLKRVTALVDKLEKSTDRAAAAVEKLANAWAKAGAAAGSNLPAIPRPGGGGAGNRAPALPKPPKVATPMDQYRYLNAVNTASGGRYQAQRNQALSRVFQHYQQLAMSGDPRAMRAVASLAPQMAKMNAPKKGFGHYAMQAVMSSRYGVGGSGGGGVQPLIGRSVQALGALGGAAVGAAGALAMLVTGVKVVLSSVHSIGGFVSRMSSAGTTAGSQVALDRLGALLGGNGSQMAQAFASNISGGTGAGFAARAGINPNSSPYGDFDMGSKFLRYAEYVARSQSYRDAQRKAIGVGSPELANLYYLNRENRGRLFNRRSGYGQGDMRDSVNGQASMAMLGQSFEKLMNKLAIRFAPALMRIVDWISSLVDRLTNAWASVPEGVKQMFFGASYSSADRANDGLRRADDEHIRALRDNTRALRDSRETQGGGGRAQGVIPRNIPGSRLGDPAYRIALEGGIG